MRLAPCIGLVLAMSSSACAVESSAPSSDGQSASESIVGAEPAKAYHEAALVNGPGFICSGAVIAPKVVLTAGHCVAGASSWDVVAPYARGQRASSVSSWTEYSQTGDFVNPNTTDVAVIVLDRAIELSAYPELADEPAAAGTEVVNVGRIDDGTPSMSALFFGKNVTIYDGSRFGFPRSYLTEEVIQPGDSGGPVYLASNASPRTIVAVNSGAGGGAQVLARVDLVYAKIQSIIASTR